MFRARRPPSPGRGSPRGGGEGAGADSDPPCSATTPGCLPAVPSSLGCVKGATAPRTEVRPAVPANHTAARRMGTCGLLKSSTLCFRNQRARPASCCSCGRGAAAPAAPTRPGPARPRPGPAPLQVQAPPSLAPLRPAHAPPRPRPVSRHATPPPRPAPQSQPPGKPAHPQPARSSCSTKAPQTARAPGPTFPGLATVPLWPHGEEPDSWAPQSPPQEQEARGRDPPGR